MSSQFHERPLVLLNEVAITKAATETGDWFRCPRAQAFNFCYYMTSAGTPSITIYIDYWLWPYGEGQSRLSTMPHTMTPGIFDASYASRDNFVPVTLGSGETTLSSWTHLNTPAGLKYPFACMRARVVEANAAAITTFSLVCGIQGL